MDRPAESETDYEVTACNPEELSHAELEICFALIKEGGAVNADTMKRDLPRSSALVIARKGNQIVGVGAIKPVRRPYAAKTARSSGVEFPPETLELGYVSVDAAHRRRGLSHRIAKALLAGHSGRLFATTDDEGMKKALSAAEFVKKGKEWPGERGMLSYWEKL